MKNSKKLFGLSLFWFLINLLIYPVSALQYETDPELTAAIRIDRNSGLISNYIYDLDQDEHGQLLLATYGSGILSYNGKRFDPYLPDSISDFPIVRRLVSLKDEVLFAHHTGVWQYKKGWSHPREVFSGDFMVYLLKKMSKDRIVLSNKEQSLLLQKDGNGDFSIATKPFPFPLKEILEVSENLWMVIDLEGKVYPYNPINGVLNEPVKFDFPIERIFYLENQLIVYSERRIDFLDLNYKITKTLPLKPDQRFFAFLEDTNRILMAGPQGLFQLDKNGFNEIPTLPDLAKSQITKMLKTSDGTIWLGTYHEGLFKTYDQDIQVIRKNRESLGYISNLLKSPTHGDSTLVVSMSSAWIYTQGSLKEIELPEKPLFPNLEAAVITSKGKVYLGGRKVLYEGHFGDLKFREVKLDGILNTTILKIVAIPGNELLVGTIEGMVWLDSALNVKMLFNQEDLNPTNIGQISYFSKDLILFGNSVDLFVWKKGKIFPFSNAQIQGQILYHTPFNTQEVWFGNSNGEAILFNLITEKVLKVIPTRIGRNVMTLGFGPDLRLLITTEMGPQLYFPDSFRLYDERVRAYEVPFNSFRFFRNGDYLLGTVNDLYLIKDSYKALKRSDPYLESVQINERTLISGVDLNLNIDSTFQLKSDLNDLVFTINQVSFQNGKDVQFSFKLNGHSDTWGPWQPSETVQFTNLGQGTYSLLVRVKSLNGLVEEFELPLKFKIQVPFWKTPIGLAFLFLVIWILFYALLNLFERRNLEKNRKLERLVNDRTAEIAEINHNLEDIVRSRTFDLENKNLELLKTIKDKNRFQRNEQIISSNTHDIICLIDTSLRINLISASVADFLGISSQAAQGKKVDEIFRSEAKVEKLLEYLSLLDSEKSSNVALLIPIRHALTEEEISVEIVGKKVFDFERTHHSGYVLNLRNVTERELLKTELVGVYKNIYRDFHDEVGNKLARIIALVSMAKLQLEEKSDFGGTINKIEATAKNLYRDTRDFIWSLDETNNNLEELSIQIRDFGEQLFDGSAISFYFFSTNLSPIPLKPNLVRDILLVIKELMTNVLKHSGASECNLYIRKQSGYVYFLILDTGIGLSESDFGKGRGLRNIQFRAQRSGGKIVFRNKIKGTLIGIKIPV